jgi:hypothetical protein
VSQRAWAMARVDDDGHGVSEFSGPEIRFDDFCRGTTFLH